MKPPVGRGATRSGQHQQPIPKRLQDLLTLLNDVHVLDFTADMARRFGEIRAYLLDKGLLAPDMELLRD